MRVKGFLMLILAVVVVAACGGASNTTSSGTPTNSVLNNGKPFNVLVATAQSGAVANIGGAEISAFKTAADLMNKSGGMNGRTIKIEVLDTGGDPTKAVSVLTERLNGGTLPDLIMPGAISSETLAMLPLIERNKIISIGQTTSSALNDPAKFPYHFATAIPYSLVSKVLSDYFTKKAYKKIGIVATNDTTGTTVLAQYQKDWTALGMTVVSQSVPTTGLDFTPQLQALQAANVDVLTTAGTTGRPGYLVLQNRVKLGWTVPVVGDTSLSSGDIYANAGAAAANGVYICAPLITQWTATPKPAVAAFITALKAQGPIITSIQTYSQAPDILHTYQAGSQQANSYDPDKVKAALENLKTQPALLTFGKIDWSSSSHFLTGTPGVDEAVYLAGPQVDGQYKAA